MAYLVSQLRKLANGTSTYMENIPVSASDFPSPNKFVENSSFQDFCLLGNFEKGQTYYLRFIIQRIPDGWYSKLFSSLPGMFAEADDMTITLLLKHTQDEDLELNPPQIIDTFTVRSLAVSRTDIGDNTIYYSYTTVFTPARPMGVLGFRLSRTAYDALAPNNNYRRWLFGGSEETTKLVFSNTGKKDKELTVSGERIVFQGENGDVCLLKNIAENNNSPWLKVGFQSRPGTLIVVNNTPIRVGRSGIYEINNGTLIESFMITAPQGAINDKIDAFLLDYAYNNE